MRFMQRGNEIRPIVHRNLRLVRQRGFEMLIIRRVILALDREYRNLFVNNERRRDVVLRRKRI